MSQNDLLHTTEGNALIAGDLRNLTGTQSLYADGQERISTEGLQSCSTHYSVHDMIGFKAKP